MKLNKLEIILVLLRKKHFKYKNSERIVLCSHGKNVLP